MEGGIAVMATLAYVPAKQDFDLFRRSLSAKLRLVFPATKELTVFSWR